MKLRPKNKIVRTSYPNASEYDKRMRKALACLAIAGSGAAVAPASAGGPSTAEMNARKKAAEAKKKKEATPETAKKLMLEKIKKEIKTCAKDLGVDDFRKRRDATRRLIAIGKVEEKSKAKASSGRSAKPVTPYRDLVIKEMERLASHKDPEVKERSRLIVKALAPKPKPAATRVEFAGQIAVEPIEFER